MKTLVIAANILAPAISGLIIMLHSLKNKGEFRPITALITLFVCIVYGIIFLLFIDNASDNLRPNEFGDFFGGILNPLVSFSVAILTFFAFYVQYEANQEIKNNFKVENFDSSLYKLIDYLKSAESNLVNPSNKNSSPFMAYRNEFSYLNLFFDYLNEHHFAPNNIKIGERTKLDIIFHYFFYGVHRTTHEIILQRLSGTYGDDKKPIFERINIMMRYLKNRYTLEAKEKNLLQIDDLSSKLFQVTNSEIKKINKTISKIKINTSEKMAVNAFLNQQNKLYHFILNGYHSALGSYFRSFSLICRFIDESDMDPKKKKIAARILRSTISQHGMVIISLNIISSLGCKLAEKQVNISTCESLKLFDNIHFELIPGVSTKSKLETLLSIKIDNEHDRTTYPKYFKFTS